MPTHSVLTSEALQCSACALSHVCVPSCVSPDDITRLDGLVKRRLRVSRGSHLFAQGEIADAIYSIRFGSFKTHLKNASERAHITGFHLPSGVLGLDGQASGTHVSEAIALEDSEVCVIDLHEFDAFAGSLPGVRGWLRRIMSQEIRRACQLMFILGNLRSDQRLAGFLVRYSNGLAALGYAPNAFVLRMTREEIGNHLGLTLETVSRVFTQLADAGLLTVQQRDVMILDRPALTRLAGPDFGCNAY